MLDLALRSDWVRDLPVCFPGRSCVDEPPLGADLINLTSALTPASPAIAAVCFTAVGASLVLIVLGLRLQWRGRGVRPWLLLLAMALVPAGVFTVWAIGGLLATSSSIYGGADGRPSALTPSSLTGSWPLVQSAGSVMVALGAVALFVMLNTAAIRERRVARFRASTLPDTASSEHDPLSGEGRD